MPFRKGSAHAARPVNRPSPLADSAVPQIDAYANAAAPDSFRHRMITNAAGFAAAALLTLSGLWLAESLAELRREQDCVLMGLRNCRQIITKSAIMTPERPALPNP